MKSSIVFVIIVVVAASNAVADPWLGEDQTLAADADHQYEPVVAYSPVHDEYLVVWYTDVSSVARIWGVRVDAQGLPIGSSFVISDPGNAQWDPAVAYDPVNDRYLVVWTFDYSGDGSDTDILGRFIPWNGPSAGDPVFAVDEALSIQQSPALAYSSDVLEFLVVWQDHEEAGPSRIFGRRVWADGSNASQTFPVVDGPLAYYDDPKIAWNRVAGEYLVVYEQPGTGGEPDIYGNRLWADGSVVLPAIGIAGWPGSEYSPDVAVCRGGYMVVWMASVGVFDDDDSEIFARSVSGEGTVGAIVTDLPGDFSNEDAPVVACNERGGEFLVTWEGRFADSNHIGVVGAFLELTAWPEASDFPIFAPIVGDQLNYRYPGLAFGARDHALVAWESERPPNGSVEDIRGRFVGNRLFADGFESGDRIYWFDPDP